MYIYAYITFGCALYPIWRCSPPLCMSGQSKVRFDRGHDGSPESRHASHRGEPRHHGVSVLCCTTLYLREYSASAVQVCVPSHPPSPTPLAFVKPRGWAGDIPLYRSNPTSWGFEVFFLLYTPRVGYTTQFKADFVMISHSAVESWFLSVPLFSSSVTFL